MSGFYVAKWSPEIEAALVDAVREHPNLWDAHSPQYKRRSLKQAAYTEVAKVLKEKFPKHFAIFSMESVSAKFANMKSTYMRNVRRNRENFSAGFEFTVPWPHFARMRFLGEGCTPTLSVSNLDSQSEGQVDIKLENQSISNESWADSERFLEPSQDTEAESQKRLLEEDLLSSSNPPAKRISSEDNVLANACSTSDSVSSRQHAKPSEEEVFGTFVATKLFILNDHSTHLKHECEKDILNIIYEYLDKI